MIRNNSSGSGQTLPDFAIAFGIFMLAVVISFSATSTLFQPYQTTQERIGEADRVANHLTYTTFAEEDANQYILDEDCTVSGMEALQGSNPTLHDKCRYDSSINDNTYREYLGLEEDREIHVTIVDADGNIETLDGTTLEFGADIPEVADTTNSYRMVQINDNIYRLKVTIW